MPNTYCLKDFEEWLNDKRNLAHDVWACAVATDHEKLELRFKGYEDAIKDALTEFNKLREPSKEL